MVNGLVPFARFLALVLCTVGGVGLAVSIGLQLFDVRMYEGYLTRIAFYLVCGYVGSRLWYWNPDDDIIQIGHVQQTRMHTPSSGRK